ncbi:LysR family transcriptional regulator [Maritalea mobilis]|uniref:LysR family transcriptional regulator n=1 Tax=Maritalea mobilis TaxID=483324 RepID=UPI001C9477EC|nr:LysR family transcriptional regulator [Maritalea mobilis]MBY6203232.1 LysR family transcriptional regulator [Maritalea mobilis]
MRHLKIYRAIRLIQREGSIRKAAEKLAVSPSALNRSVQAFEEEMNLAVFERLPHGVRLTTAGELLLNLVDRHLTEFDDLQAQLTSMRDGMSGTFRLSIGTDLDAGLILDLVAEFQTSFGGVSVEIVNADDAAPLQRRDVDLALLTNPVTDDTLEVIYAHEMPIVAWSCDPNPPSTTRFDLADLEGVRLVVPPEGTGTRIAISHFLRRKRLSAPVTTAVSAAHLSPRVGRAPTICVFPETVAEGLLGFSDQRRLDLDLGTVQIAAVRVQQVPITRPVQGFLAILQRGLETDRSRPMGQGPWR